jgi:hypothetical protein
MASLASETETRALFTKGQRVRIKGIKSKPFLNGKICVVINKIKNKDRYKLTGFERDITGFIKPLSIATKNLTIVTNSPIDWTIYDDGSTICDVIRKNPTLRNIDECHIFEETLRQVLVKGYEMPCLPFSAAIVKDMKYNTSTHSVFFCAFDVIGHHFVVETFQGQARLYQSYIKSVRTMNHDNKFVEQLGFTAGEWLQPKGLPKDTKWGIAHRKYGGGHFMNYETLHEFCDMLLRIQEEAGKIIAAMIPQLPANLLKKQEIWESKSIKEQTKMLPPINTWANYLKENMPFLSNMYLPESEVLFTNEHCPEHVEGCKIDLPYTLTSQFKTDYYALTGHRASSPNFITMICLHKCIGMQVLRDDGTKISLGWTTRATMIPKNNSSLPSYIQHFA